MDDNRRRLLTGVGTACAAAGCLEIVGGSGGETDRKDPDLSGAWPAFGRTNTNTAAAPERSLPPDLGVKWTYRKPAAAVTAQPVLGSGAVIAGSHDGYVYCAEVTTGEHRWVLGNALSPHSDYPILSAGVLGPERAFVPTGDSHLTACNLKQGKKPWMSQRIGGNTLAYTAPVLREGILSAGSDAANLYAIGTESTERVETYETNQPVPHPPALGEGTLVGATYNAIHAFTPNGKRRWRVEMDPTGAPVIAGGRAYVPTAAGERDGGRLHAFDLDTGETVWTSEVPKDPLSPVVASKRIYVTGVDGVVALTLSGAEHWQTTLPAAAGAPALAGETVVVPFMDGSLRGLDAADGREQWRVAVGGTLTAPAVGGGFVVVGSSDGFLAAIG